MYGKGLGVKKDLNEAYKWFLTAAENGHPNAQYAIGNAYISGEVLGKDSEKGIDWLKKSYRNKNPRAMMSLAIIYIEGKEVSRDIEKAHVLATLAKLHGHDKADKFIQYIETNIRQDQVEMLRESTRKLLEQ